MVGFGGFSTFPVMQLYLSDDVAAASNNLTRRPPSWRGLIKNLVGGLYVVACMMMYS